MLFSRFMFYPFASIVFPFLPANGHIAISEIKKTKMNTIEVQSLGYFNDNL